MTTYAYRAIDKSGKLRKGKLSAAGDVELYALLKSMDLELIEARQSSILSLRGPKRRKKIPAFMMHKVCRQCADLLKAGLTIDQTLDCLIRSLDSGPLRGALLTCRKDINAGSGVHDALARHRELFSPVHLSILKAAELSARLPDGFDKLARDFNWQGAFAHDIKKALRYPLFLMLVALSVSTFMVLRVIPEILNFLGTLGSDLPLMTRLLIHSAKLLESLWIAAPLTLLSSALLLVIYARSSEQALAKLDRWKLKVPFVGSVFKSIHLARFTSSLSMLIEVDIPLAESICLASRATENRFLLNSITKASTTIENGSSLSVAFAPLLPYDALQVLRIAEQTNRLSLSLREIGASLEKDAKERLSSMVGVLEPTLTLIVGALMAWIVLAVLGPLYGSLATLSGGL